MDLSLVLPCPGGFDGPPFPGESHIPALILGILEGCVIVLQDYLCEDTVPAPAVGLCQETGKGSYVRSRHMDRGVLSDSFMHTSKCYHYTGFIQPLKMTVLYKHCQKSLSHSFPDSQSLHHNVSSVTINANVTFTKSLHTHSNQYILIHFVTILFIELFC